MPFAAPNVRVVKHIFLLRVHDSWAWPSTIPLTDECAQKLLLLAIVMFRTSGQSKAERIDRRCGENTFLRDIKMNPFEPKKRERRKMFHVLATIMTGNNP